MLANRNTIIENQSIFMSRSKAEAGQQVEPLLTERIPVNIRDAVTQVVIIDMAVSGMRTLLVLVFASLFIFSVVTSYKKKDLGNLSFVSVFFYQLLSFLYVINLIN